MGKSFANVKAVFLSDSLLPSPLNPFLPQISSGTVPSTLSKRFSADLPMCLKQEGTERPHTESRKKKEFINAEGFSAFLALVR